MTEVRPIVGEDLSESDKALMERLFSNPRIWPDSAKTWIADYVSQNSYLPAAQLQGLRGVSRYLTKVTDDADFNSTTETDAFTFALAAKTLGPGDILEGTFLYSMGCDDAGNNVTLRWYAGSTFLSSVTFAEPNISSVASRREGLWRVTITNLGSYSDGMMHSYSLYDFATQQEERIFLTTADFSQDMTFKATVDWSGAGTQSFTRRFASLKLTNPLSERQ